MKAKNIKRKLKRQPGGSLKPVGSVPFECEACGLTGEVDSPRIMESVSCPECNARYLYWPEGKLHGEKSAWKCVVRPYFAASPNTERSHGGDE